jgi:hypothetical protein
VAAEEVVLATSLRLLAEMQETVAPVAVVVDGLVAQAPEVLETPHL